MNRIVFSSEHPHQLAAAGVLLLGVLVSGCRQTAAGSESGGSASQPRPLATSSMTDQGSNTVSNLQDAIKKDMAYADLRKLLIEGGWEPVKDPQCQVQVAGYDQKTCSDNQDLALCRACEQMPELSAYSGDGFATSRFNDVRAGKTLKLVSYGMIEDWNVPGDDSRLRIEEWESADTSAQD